jgi:type III secretion protein C
MRKLIAGFLILGASLFALPLPELRKDDGHTINFQEVPAVEFVRFVSRISGVNFIYNQKELQFNVSLSTGKPISSEQVVQALIRILKVHGLAIFEEDGYLVIHKATEVEHPDGHPSPHPDRPTLQVDQLLASLQPVPIAPSEDPPQFLVKKLQYHSGKQIEETIKKITADLKLKPGTSPRYIDVLQSIQWVEATNSLVCSGDEESLQSVKQLIERLDAPLRQVFIEVLVVETDIRHSTDFGLQWAAGGKYRDSIGMGMSNFTPTKGGNPFAAQFQNVSGSNPPTGPGQIPMGNGFDLGVIGDIITHKGKTFLSLASLVSALQTDGDTSIVLNQKIITQDNKNSKIFVGDNIPFTGSVVQTVGGGQQTTANVEYRDIGVTLSITPRLGDDDIITIDLDEEITEALPTLNSVSNNQVNGIQTTKTNMMTHVHVPDQHFLVLSGMIRNSNMRHKTGLPCLGGLPWIGVLFSQNRKLEEKRNIIIFVRPHIIHSMDDYKKVTEAQKENFDSSLMPGQ